VKRALDIILALAGLTGLSPLFLLSALAVKLGSPGPVFYRQVRIGRRFRPFGILKFRTMVVGADKKGSLITSGGDSRVTAIGRVLRKTKIDELPQLINVLRGEMSIVGPRPEVPRYVELFREDYEGILTVRPGITDIASLVFRDEEALLASQEDPERYYREVHLPRKIRYAQEYMRRSSVFFDLKIILMTLRGIVRGRRGEENRADPTGRARGFDRGLRKR